ncbi:MAG: hypothetical protein JNJ48_06110 [Phycisphaerae bacterium]|nr:hypothetical protein [Phycisphaerae bacterium]
MNIVLPGRFAAALCLAVASVALAVQPGDAPKPAPAGEPTAPAAPRASGFKHEGTAENLKALFKKLRELQDAKDHATASALVQELMPTAERVRKHAFRPDVPKEKLDQVGRFYDTMPKPKDDQAWSAMIQGKAEMTEVLVISGKTEDLAKGHPDMPGGVKRVAETLLKPGMSFFTVKYVKPGETIGMAYHLLFFDGAKWCMAGPLWRADRPAPEPAAPGAPAESAPKK